MPYPRINEMFLVEIVYVKGSNHIVLVKKSDIAAYIEATWRLHKDPGINPHNGGQTAEIDYIYIDSFDEPGAYWWSTPSLYTNKNAVAACGAAVSSRMRFHTVYFKFEGLNEEAVDLQPWKNEKLTNLRTSKGVQYGNQDQD